MAKFIVVFSLIALIVVFNCATCIMLHRLQSFFPSTKCYPMGVILNIVYLINAKSINCNITCVKHNSSDHNLNWTK